jgi:ribose transport system substrate-binding protein
VRIVGFDATPDGLNAVEAGTMAATVAQQPKEMGSLCVESAWKLSQRDTLPKELPVPVVLRTRQNPASGPES